MSNMCTILSFDSRSIKVLLDEKNNQYFHKDFPIFYKIMQKKRGLETYTRSALDVAIENNQI